MDFSVIKEKLCEWLETQWDHRFLVWIEDPAGPHLREMDPTGVVAVPFNPTAENMAQYLVDVIGPQQLAGTGVTLVNVRIEETAKCSASYHKE
jgi:6-pyruvoyltetrahydropterin/6-carboxytetrahydropterin synthase